MSFSSACNSSSVISLAFSAFFAWSIASRRILRTLTFALSASLPTCLANSLRRSSVNCGIIKRITEPSLVGVIPISLIKIARSMSFNEDLS